MPPPRRLFLSRHLLTDTPKTDLAGLIDALGFVQLDSVNTLARAHDLTLWARRPAAFHNMPFHRPIPDPISQDPVTLTIAPDQPLATRLGRLGIAATERGHGLTFADEVSRLLWEGTVTGWDSGDHLAQAAARAGLDLAELAASVAANPAHYDAPAGKKRHPVARGRPLGRAHDGLCR